jgi:hypothetical protein
MILTWLHEICTEKSSFQCQLPICADVVLEITRPGIVVVECETINVMCARGFTELQ